MKKFKKIVYEVVILIFPVMVGVYLGMLVNNWSEAKAEKLQTVKILQNIIKEIEFNQIETSESLQYFSQLRDSISYSKDKNRSPSGFSFWKGLNPPLLKNSSFQSASVSGVLGRLDIDLIEQLTTLYNYQDDLKLQTNTYVQSVTSKIGSDTFTNEKYLIILENYAHDQVSSEETIKEELEKTKQQVNEYLDLL